MTLEEAARAMGATDVPGSQVEPADGNLIPEVEPDDEYQEVVIEFFKFDTEGQILEGLLVAKAQNTIRGSKVGKYTLIRKEDKMKVTFNGGTVLDELMASVAAGKEIKIVYIGDEIPMESGQFPMKRFKVFQKL